MSSLCLPHFCQLGQRIVVAGKLLHRLHQQIVGTLRLLIQQLQMRHVSQQPGAVFALTRRRALISLPHQFEASGNITKQLAQISCASQAGNVSGA